MHLDQVRVAGVGLSLLAACESARHGSPEPLRESEPSASATSDPALLAGGETSEFSGGDVLYGYCPKVASRTRLDLERQDVAQLVALAQGQHEVPLRWQRGFPDEKVRGFAERTSLLLDVQVIAAEDVVCVGPADGGYETSGYRALLRRLELAVQFSTSDGAVRGAFQQPFVRSMTENGAPFLFGGARVPIGELEGTLELGVDPELEVASETLGVSIVFAERTLRGILDTRIELPGVYASGSRGWSPIGGVFPAPDEGCNSGLIVPLDEVRETLGDTPRAAYERGRSSLPAEPLLAEWEDTLSRTELTLGAGAPTHACSDGDTVDVYSSVRIESADGLLKLQHPAVAKVRLQRALAGQAAPAIDIALSGSVDWTRRAEFETLAGIKDLDMGLAEYGSLWFSQNFNVDQQSLFGDLGVGKWENHAAARVERGLRWCAGSGCELYGLVPDRAR